MDTRHRIRRLRKAEGEVSRKSMLAVTKSIGPIATRYIGLNINSSVSAANNGSNGEFMSQADDVDALLRQPDYRPPVYICLAMPLLGKSLHPLPKEGEAIRELTFHRD